MLITQQLKQQCVDNTAILLYICGDLPISFLLTETFYLVNAVDGIAFLEQILRRFLNSLY